MNLHQLLTGAKDDSPDPLTPKQLEELDRIRTSLAYNSEDAQRLGRETGRSMLIQIAATARAAELGVAQVQTEARLEEAILARSQEDKVPGGN